MIRQTRHRLLALGLLSLAASGCGPYSGNIEGTLGGAEFDPAVGYWGGPFIAFSNQDLDCQDLWFVAKDYDDTNPSDQGFSLLQITFDDSDVVGGDFTVAGESPVDAYYLVGDDDVLTIDEALSGTISIDDFTGSAPVKGTLSLEMVGGSVAGDFKVEHCANLSSAY